MDSRDGILRQRIDHACAMIEVLEHAAEGLDARAVVREADVREVEERLLRRKPGDERASEVLAEWSATGGIWLDWRVRRDLRPSGRGILKNPCGTPTRAGPQTL